jgi:heme exporter protein D
MGTTAHVDFIAAAYASAVIIIGALIAWVMLDYRAQQRTLAELEKRGILRRSGPARSDHSVAQAKEDA